jgi:hypothetical protein
VRTGEIRGMVANTDDARLRRIFTIERPPPQPSAARRLRHLVALTALATVAVDLINLEFADDAGFALVVRTVWALLRALGFLFLMRTIRYGRVISRPFGLILAATTVFAVGRLVVPRAGGLVPSWPVLVGFAVLAALCAAVIWLLFRSREIDAHLSRASRFRQPPVWVLTARVAGLSLSALLLVPCLVAIGTMFGDPRLPRALGIPMVLGWLISALAFGFVVPWVMIFVVLGRRWARAALAVVAVVVGICGPLLCWALLGIDGLLRDGVPLAIAAVVCLSGLRRSRQVS